MATYCVSKAAMDMFFKCLAAEETDVRVLNYAPGPLETNMATILSEKVCEESTKKFFKESLSNGTIIQPRDSVKKLMWLLNKDEFESGAHIDFYDVTIPE